MFWGILQRMIFWELARAFFMSLAALTTILLLAGIVAEASQRGLSPAQILVAMPLIIPSTLPYTIPSTTLFAVCVVYGRLAHDNEIVAVKAAGINMLKVIWPAVLLGLLTSAATIALYMETIPQTQYMLRTRFLQDVEEFFYSLLKSERTINHPRLTYAIWVRQVQGKRLIDVTFKRRDEKGEFDVIARAREADLLFDYANNKVVVRMRHGEVYSIGTAAHAFFENQEWPEDMPDSPFVNHTVPKAREMTWVELLQRAQKIEDERQGKLDEIETTVLKLKTSAPSPSETQSRQQHIYHLKNQAKALEGEARAVRCEQNMRPAIAMGCLCFALVGCPIGIWFSKRDYLSAFITCFLPIVIVYYPLLLSGHSLARSGRISPDVGVWVSDLLAGLVGVLLLRHLMKN